VNATEVSACPAESNGSLLPGIWRDSLYVTCGLTACTPVSAPGPTLGSEYGKTLTFYTLVTVTAEVIGLCSAASDKETYVYNVAGSWSTLKTRCKPKPDCSPPVYLFNHLLIIANWSVNWFACVHRIGYLVCRRPEQQLHFLSYTSLATVTRIQLCGLGLDLTHKIGFHGNVP